MSLFGDSFAISEDAPADPGNIPDNTYQAVVKDVLFQTSKRSPVRKDGNPNTGVLFIYTIADGDFEGADIIEWKSASPHDDKRTQGFLKQRLMSLGVPEDRVNTIEKDDLKGTNVLVTTRARNGFTNIVTLVLDEDGDGTGSADSYSTTDSTFGI